MAEIKGLSDVELSGKKVLMRVDYNVPLDGNRVTDDTRLRATLASLERVLTAGASLILMSHLGRPEAGRFDEALSMKPVAERLSSLLNKEVLLVDNWKTGVNLNPGEVVMLENIRFESGETENDEQLAKQLAALCDVFVNDAFATAHRAQASTHGVARFAKTACAGPLLKAEIDALAKAFKDPASPMVAIVGGSKVSTKLTVLESLMDKIDQLIIGGGIANTFLKAKGYNIGNSLCEDELISAAKNLFSLAEKQGKQIPLPIDVVCAKEFSNDAKAIVRMIEDVKDDDLILDVGPQTSALYAGFLKKASTIVWNGPLGVFEFDQFGEGTQTLAETIAASKAFSVAGGGDTLAAISKYNVADKISYISTGGGAFLEFLEGKTLPAIHILEKTEPH
ncbi:MAG: phosphoglycerate kinase [Gammaproteobacteria bacterium]|nr:phosphoglycerate kinase [Gammaproteobacteria bacterium]